MKKIISVTNQKEGWKTTTTKASSNPLAAIKKNVLIIDADLRETQVQGWAYHMILENHQFMK